MSPAYYFSEWHHSDNYKVSTSVLFTHLWWTKVCRPGTQCYFYSEKEEDGRRGEERRQVEIREDKGSEDKRRQAV